MFERLLYQYHAFYLPFIIGRCKKTVQLAVRASCRIHITSAVFYECAEEVMNNHSSFLSLLARLSGIDVISAGRRKTVMAASRVNGRRHRRRRSNGVE